MSESKERPATESERPPDDLKRERDAFIQQFFRKGAQFTEELLKENERLREQLDGIEAENGRLRAHVASDAAIRDLLKKIEELEHEKQELMSRSARADLVKESYGAQYHEVENELASFANLYVATAQLHAARSVRNVLRVLKELLAQLLGSAAFAIYFVSDDGGELVSIASEGVPLADVARFPADKGALGKAFTSGEIVFTAGVSPQDGPRSSRRSSPRSSPRSGRDLTQASIDDPACVIPLTLDGKTIGVIAIFGNLPQKTEFVQTDRELFKLLGAQAAPALVNARLFTDAGRKVPGIQAFLDLED
ncbi:MAG: GAF domain-containing protein [Byssovorax sp.]